MDVTGLGGCGPSPQPPPATGGEHQRGDVTDLEERLRRCVESGRNVARVALTGGPQKRIAIETMLLTMPCN